MAPRPRHEFDQNMCGTLWDNDQTVSINAGRSSTVQQFQCNSMSYFWRTASRLIDSSTIT